MAKLYFYYSAMNAGKTTTLLQSAYNYHEKFWNPALYWRWQDYDWKKPGKGQVDVGEVITDVNEPVLEDEPAAANEPR